MSRPSGVGYGRMRSKAVFTNSYEIIHHTSYHFLILSAGQILKSYLMEGESPFPVAASTSALKADTFPFFLMILKLKQN